MKSENFYDIEDIQEILGIGRNAAYSFVQKAYKEKTPFRVIKIGKLRINFYFFTDYRFT